MPGILVLLRHGQSTWNELNLFTGWHDVPLTPRGVAEATAAGTTMAAAGLTFDEAHTSLLTRAIETNRLALAAMGASDIPVHRDWRLNERLRHGAHVLVTAHGNSLRALIMHLENISSADISEFNVPTGVPRKYEFTSEMSVAKVGYLGDPQAIAAATDAVARQASK